MPSTQRPPVLRVPDSAVWDIEAPLDYGDRDIERADGELFEPKRASYKSHCACFLLGMIIMVSRPKFRLYVLNVANIGLFL